jgi:hypothetical protein
MLRRTENRIDQPNRNRKPSFGEGLYRFPTLLKQGRVKYRSRFKHLSGSFTIRLIQSDRTPLQDAFAKADAMMSHGVRRIDPTGGVEGKWRE